MKKALNVSLLALFMSPGAFAANYALNNDNMAFSFDDASSAVVVKDTHSGHQLSPQEPFFLTLPDETVIHTADFKISRVEKKENTLVVTYIHPDFNVTMTLNLLKDKYASINYTIAAVGKARNVAKITFFPTKKQAQAPYVDGAINSSPIIADTFFMLPNKPVVNTYAYEGTTNLNVELKTPVQPETPVSYTTWFGTVAETSQLRRSVNQFIDAVRPRPYKPYLHYNSWMDIGFFTTYTEQDVNDVIKLVADAIAGLAQKEVSSLTVTPSKTTYQVGDAIDADHDLKVVGNYSAGMGNVTLSADQFTLDYDFSAPADAAKVTVTLKSNPNVTETYTVAVTARAEGGSGNGSDGAGNGGATINPDTGEGDKTNGANGDKITGVLSNTGSAVTAVGLAVVVLGVAGGVSLALRRKRS